MLCGIYVINTLRSHTCGAGASYPQRVEDGIGAIERR